MNLVSNPKKTLIFSFIFVLITYLSFIRIGAAGSLYDYLIPLLISVFLLVNFNNFNKKFGISLFLILLTNLFAFFSILLRINFDNLFGNFALLLRLINFSLIFYLISKEYNPISLKLSSSKKNISQLILLNFIFYITTIILSVIYFLRGSWRFGFPFYSNGTDPHVWGPSVTLALIFISISFLQLNNLNLFLKVSNLSKNLLFLIIPFLTFSSISSGSRGAIAVFVSFLFLLFFKFFDFLHLRIFITNKKIFLSLFFKLLRSLFIIILISVLLFFTFPNIQEYILIRSERFISITKRTFEVLALFTGEDGSRGSRIEIVQDFIYNGEFLRYPFGRIKETYREDSGIMFFIINYGWVSGLTLLSAAFFELRKYFLQTTYIITPISIFVSACLFISFFGSETILIPRFLLFPMPAIYLYIYLRKYILRLNYK